MKKSDKNYLVALLLCFFLGTLGIHRFYLKKIGTGILMLITIGGLGIWWFIDLLIVLLAHFKDKEGRIIKP